MKVLALAAGFLAVVIGPTGVQTPVSGVDAGSLAAVVRPQDDFYRFVNAAWLDTVEIPPDLVAVSAMTEVQEQTHRDLLVIVESIVARPVRRAGSPEQQLADLYASVMDEVRLQELGVTPIQEELDRIAAIDTSQGFAAEVGRLQALGVGAPFDEAVVADPVDPSRTVLVLRQGGILLPDRDYYLGSQDAYAQVREGYAAYLTTVFELVGRSDPPGRAAAVISIERALAEAQWTAADNRSPTREPSRLTLSDLARRMPGFDWREWARPQGAVGVVVLAQPSFFGDFADLAATAPLDDWKSWLTARYVTASATFLSRDFSRVRFAFFGEQLSGQLRSVPRWRRAITLLNEHLGDALGRLYVERHFPPSSKAEVERIARDVVGAYRDAIRSAAWLSSAARREALTKLSSLEIRIGYPSRWHSYRGVAIRPDDLFGNVQRARQFAARADRGDLYPADAGYWATPPQMVTAYYDRTSHQVVLPAAMLQPPFFTPGADDAANYGAVGAILGHEISHALDDLGRRLDPFGRLRDWWTPADQFAIRQRAHALAGQFAAHLSIDDVPVDAMTLDENLADLGGVAVAYQAYQRRAGSDASVLDGFTGSQRFFIAWARIWRTRERNPYERQAQLLRPHTPDEFRVNGTLSNLDAFVEAFDVREGDRLYRAPDDRVRIW